jgi:hypothetical protein
MGSRNKGGRPPFEVTEKVIAQIEQLAGYGLTIPQIAAVIGCSAATLERRKADADTVLTAFTRGRARAEAMIGKSLFEKAKAGEGWAVQWWEKTRAGRSEKQVLEHSGPEGGPMKVEVSDATADARLAAIVARAAARDAGLGDPGSPAPPQP